MSALCIVTLLVLGMVAPSTQVLQKCTTTCVPMPTTTTTTTTTTPIPTHPPIDCFDKENPCNDPANLLKKYPVDERPIFKYAQCVAVGVCRWKLCGNPRREVFNYAAQGCIPK